MNGPLASAITLPRLRIARIDAIIDVATYILRALPEPSIGLDVEISSTNLREFDIVGATISPFYDEIISNVTKFWHRKVFTRATRTASGRHYVSHEYL
jgi:hypothetical protein